MLSATQGRLMNREKDLRNVLVSICRWNAKRFERRWNSKLVVALIKEEVDELLTAEKERNLVETLDALGDIFYACVSGIWKLGHDPMDMYLSIKESGMIPEDETLSDWLNTWGLRPPMVNLYKLVNRVLLELEQVCNSKELATMVLRSICDSNDTKSEECLNVDGSKNLKVSKGAYYEPPTVDLTNIAKFITKG